MGRKFKALKGFIMFANRPSTTKGQIVEFTSPIHISWINYWVNLGYLEEIKED